jgi:hypothetical protein
MSKNNVKVIESLSFYEDSKREKHSEAEKIGAKQQILQCAFRSMIERNRLNTNKLQINYKKNF